MVYPWMSEDYDQLGGLQECAEILAQKSDWAPLYDIDVLQDTNVPCAALISYEDVYVEREYSEETARLLGDKCQVWVTNGESVASGTALRPNPMRTRAPTGPPTQPQPDLPPPPRPPPVPPPSCIRVPAQRPEGLPCQGLHDAARNEQGRERCPVVSRRAARRSSECVV